MNLLYPTTNSNSEEKENLMFPIEGCVIIVKHIYWFRHTQLLKTFCSLNNLQRAVAVC